VLVELICVPLGENIFVGLVDQLFQLASKQFESVEKTFA